MLIMAVNNGYWTDIIATIATSAAVIIALINTAYTMNKDRKNRDEDDKKALYMADLITLSVRRSIYRRYTKIKNGSYRVVGQDGQEILPYDDKFFSKISEDKYPTIKDDILKLYSKKNLFHSKSLIDHCNEYKEKLENILTEQYTRLHIDSIKNIENKIEGINSVLFIINTIIYSEINTVVQEKEPLDDVRASKVKDILDKFTTLEAALDQSSKGLSDGNYPSNEGENRSKL